MLCRGKWERLTFLMLPLGEVQGEGWEEMWGSRDGGRSGLSDPCRAGGIVLVPTIGSVASGSQICSRASGRRVVCA